MKKVIAINFLLYTIKYYFCKVAERSRSKGRNIMLMCSSIVTKQNYSVAESFGKAQDKLSRSKK